MTFIMVSVALWMAPKVEDFAANNLPAYQPSGAMKQRRATHP